MRQSAEHIPIKRENITISENVIITLPSKPAETVWMNETEITELFGVYVQTIRSHIKSTLKSEVIKIGFRHGATQYGNYLLPNYYGLEMITALAFRIQSRNAQLLRKYIIGKFCAVSKVSPVNIFVSYSQLMV